MRIIKIKGVVLKEFKQVDNIVQYGFNNVNDDRLNEVYLTLCNKYDSVERHEYMNIFDDTTTGYFKCSNNK